MLGSFLAGVLLFDIVGTGAAVAQQSGRGSLFPSAPAGPGTAVGGGITPAKPGGNSSLFPRDAVGTSAPIGDSGLPVDLLTGKPQGEAARRAAPADPLRGLAVTPEQMRTAPPSEYRAPAQAERVRQPAAGGGKPASQAAGSGDPLKGLVNDSDRLLQFNAPKGSEAAVPQATVRSGEEGGGSLFRMNRTPTPTAGMAVPDLTGAGAATLSMPNTMPNTTLSRTGMPSAAPDIATLDLGAPSSSGGERAAPGYRPAGASAPDDGPMFRREKLQYSLTERIMQLFVGTLEQPLAYVLLIGVFGFIVAIKLRRA